jgi:hypothetical protein
MFEWEVKSLSVIKTFDWDIESVITNVRLGSRTIEWGKWYAKCSMLDQKTLENSTLLHDHDYSQSSFAYIKPNDKI